MNFKVFLSLGTTKKYKKKKETENSQTNIFSRQPRPRNVCQSSGIGATKVHQLETLKETGIDFSGIKQAQIRRDQGWLAQKS